MRRRRAVRLAVCTALSALHGATAVDAATPLAGVRVSSDVTVTLGGFIASDEAIVADDLAGALAPIPLGTVDAAADVVAYDLLADGDQLVAFDAVVALPGGVTAAPADVVRFDGSSFSIELAAATVGVPAGVRVDALGHTDTELLLSFDVTVELGGLTVFDEDLVAFDGGGFALFFSGAAAGVPAALDLDAVHRLGNGHLLVSFDGAGTLGGVTFADEDALELDPAGPTWELVYDGSSQHAGWGPADLDALAASELDGTSVLEIPTLGGLAQLVLSLLLAAAALHRFRRVRHAQERPNQPAETYR